MADSLRSTPASRPMAVAAAAFLGSSMANAFVVPKGQPLSEVPEGSNLISEARVTDHTATAAPADSALSTGSVLTGLAGVTLALAHRRLAQRRSVESRANCVVTARKAFDKELGVTMPMRYFDPLGLASDGESEAFRRRRMAEIKNGRVAMWACMGYIVPEYYRFPGYLSPSQNLKFTDVPNGLAALSKVPGEGWAQIGIFIAFLELFALRQGEGRLPGDTVGAGKLGLPVFLFGGKAGPCDPVANERSLNAELNNGRLAMVAIVGMISQNGFLGTTGPSMWLPGA